MTQLSNVVILNGPPKCGKDTLAERLVEHGYKILMFKDGLYEATAAYYDLPLEYVAHLCTDRRYKDFPHSAFGSMSPREALIHVSEDVWKPQFGARVFGERLAEAAYDFGNVIVPDGGFKDELNAVEASHNVTVVRLHRKGYDFKGDSRTYAEESWRHYQDTRILDLHLEEGEIDKGVSDLLKLIG